MLHADVDGSLKMGSEEECLLPPCLRRWHDTDLPATEFRTMINGGEGYLSPMIRYFCKHKRIHFLLT
jgi:hypothetical protein